MTEQEEFEFRARLEQEQATQPAQSEPSVLSELGRQVGLTGRAAVSGLTGIPTALGDVLNTGLNMIPGVNLGMPSQATQELLTKAGVPEPRNQLERAVQAGAGALAGAGGQIKAAQAVQQGLQQAPVAKAVAGQLSAAPVAQLGAAAPSAAAAQYVGEETGSPLAGLAAGTLVGGLAGVRPKQAEPRPIIEAVKQQATAAYKTADDAGIVVKPSSFAPAIGNMMSAVERSGFDPDLHPAISTVLRRLESDSKQKALTLGELDKMRQVVRNAVPASDDKQQRFVKIITQELDDYVNKLSFKDVNAKDPKAGISALQEARSLWSRTKKAEILDDMMQSAEIRSALPNASENELLRRSVINLAANKADMKQFTAAEQNMIKSAAKGGNLQRVLGIVEKIAPGSSASSIARSVSASMAASALLGPAGAAIAPAVGLTAKQIGSSLAAQRAENLRNSLLLGRQYQSTPRGALTPLTASQGLLSSYLQSQ